MVLFFCLKNMPPERKDIQGMVEDLDDYLADSFNLLLHIPKIYKKTRLVLRN